MRQQQQEPGTGEPSALKGAEMPSPGGCRLLCLQHRAESMQFHRPDHLCRKLESSHAMEGDTESLRGSAACASSHSILMREPGRCSCPAAPKPSAFHACALQPTTFLQTVNCDWTVPVVYPLGNLALGSVCGSALALVFPGDLKPKTALPTGRGANVDHFLCPNSNNNNNSSTVVIIMLAGNY